MVFFNTQKGLLSFNLRNTDLEDGTFSFERQRLNARKTYKYVIGKNVTDFFFLNKFKLLFFNLTYNLSS